jgi:hypothetical protein
MSDVSLQLSQWMYVLVFVAIFWCLVWLRWRVDLWQRRRNAGATTAPGNGETST